MKLPALVLVVDGFDYGPASSGIKALPSGAKAST
jgi:hypothetical protein